MRPDRRNAERAREWTAIGVGKEQRSQGKGRKLDDINGRGLDPLSTCGA
jgi:hypothetical protein